GVLTIIAGLYLLGVSKIDNKISSNSLTPFKMIFSSKEARYMLIAVVIWMITSVFDGLGVYGIVCGPLTKALVWVLTKTMVSSFILLLICFRLYRHELRFKIFFEKKILYLGFFYSLENILHMTGVAVWDVVFVVAIKRISILFNVLIGIFKDKDPGGWKRILAALIAIIGFVIIKIAAS
ncbi:hypothetical protein K8R32_04200, partial [bacterium]|nr:hypothetical protein [bacterium]